MGQDLLHGRRSRRQDHRKEGRGNPHTVDVGARRLKPGDHDKERRCALGGAEAAVGEVPQRRPSVYLAELHPHRQRSAP